MKEKRVDFLIAVLGFVYVTFMALVNALITEVRNDGNGRVIALLVCLIAIALSIIFALVVNLEKKTK